MPRCILDSNFVSSHFFFSFPFPPSSIRLFFPLLARLSSNENKISSYKEEHIYIFSKREVDFSFFLQNWETKISPKVEVSKMHEIMEEAGVYNDNKLQGEKNLPKLLRSDWAIPPPSNRPFLLVNLIFHRIGHGRSNRIEYIPIMNAYERVPLPRKKEVEVEKRIFVSRLMRWCRLKLEIAYVSEDAGSKMAVGKEVT